MMKNFIIILVLLFQFCFTASGQLNCRFEHYGLIDGLPQRTVMSIVQDKKGFMWFSTWDGICRFDGYNFTTFKSRLGDSLSMVTNRVDRIYEDRYGDIWLHMYNKDAYRFDTKTEKFRSIHTSGGIPFSTDHIITQPSGKVWLTSENMGCVCVLDSTNVNKSFNVENGYIQGNKINAVYEDRDSYSWILTNNGLTRYESGKDECITYLAEDKGFRDRMSFYSVFETDSEIWFGGNNGRIYRYQKKEATFKNLDTGTGSNIISIKEIIEGKLLVLTSEDGFLIYDKEKRQFSLYDKSNLPDLRTNEIISSYIDRNKNVWLELNDYGIAKFDYFKGTLKHYYSINPREADAFAPPHFLILEDKVGRVWVHPRGGGFSYYDEVSDRLLPFYNDPLSPDWRFSNMLHDAYFDRQGDLWFSTRSHGLEKAVFDDNYFNFKFFNSEKEPFSRLEVRGIFEDKDRNIWFGCRDGITRVYDSDRNFIGNLCENGVVSPVGTPLNGLGYSFIQDEDGSIWIGTRGKGLFILEKDHSKKNLTFKITNYKNNPANVYSLNNNNIYSIHKDDKGRYWIGTYGGGLNLFDKKSGRFINQKNNLSKYPIELASRVRTIGSDKLGNLYVGTTFGLIVFPSTFDLPEKIDFKVYSKNTADKNSLGANDIFSIYTSSNGETYIGTFGGGFSKVIERDSSGLPSKFRTYDVSDGLLSDVILSLVEDNHNKLWISSEGYLTKFDPQRETFEIFSDVTRIMDKQYFSEAAAIRTKSGEIFFGCSKGVLSFVPDNITENDFKPYLALLRFRISNKNANLPENIDNMKEVVLTHKENFISIEYASLDYVNPENILYAYRLDGVDKEWVFNQKQRVVNYSNLSPGNYVFRVKSTNSNGNWVDNERVLRITIRPSFWQTSWAYLLYFILTIVVSYIVLRSIFLFYRMRDKVELEHEQTEMKTRFFTDISHEIRTPLTMIVSPMENILENEKTPQDVKSQLQLVLKNANRMLTMVNQILDFRKIQKQKLNVQETHIGHFVSEVCSSFVKTAEEQNTRLIINNHAKLDKIWVDRDSVEKLVFNLLSNAVKNTPSGRSIEVNVFKKDDNIAVQVRDEGKGMSKDVLSKLFTRFASFNSDKSKPSTGIGLSIVKEVIDKHHAKIQVDSDVDRGSSFTVLFPLGLDHFVNDINVNIAYPLDDKTEDGEKDEHILLTDVQSETDEANKDRNKEEDRQTVLIVEDDPDLRGFIQTILSDDYKIYEAENGKEGYDLAVKILPDFILSDIMMPEMDGVEFLQKIRENHDTSHIPFILLTAKSSIEDKLDGIGYGADDYMTKPFNVKLLKAKVNGIIQQRKRLYSMFSGGKPQQFAAPEKQEEQPFKMTTQDELFLSRVKDVIEENIDDSDFLVDDLVATTSVSRKVFFKKIKSLTGLAPVEFIREVKIKYAAELLKTQQYMVKEVSYMVGFSDIKYFTQCFKKMYGMTPSQYRDQNQ